jgi:uncharacterized membrane protein
MSLSSTKTRTVLVISMMLNVFLLGTVTGGAYQWINHEKAVQSAAQPRGLRFAAAELPVARRQALRRALRETRRANLPMLAKAREGRIDVARSLAAPSFERAALDAALASTREADSAVRAGVEGTIADFAATLTPDERLKLVDALERRGPLRAAGRPQK